MSVYGLFQPSVMGMMSQAHSLSNIGFNIANVNTGGYKATDTQFATLVSKTLDKQSDLGGVRPVDLQRIDQQGLLLSSNSNLDLGINGRGFFMVNTELDGSGETFYTRDGAFNLNADRQIVTLNGYLVEPSITIPQDATKVTINESGIVYAYVPGQAAATQVGQIAPPVRT